MYWKFNYLDVGTCIYLSIFASNYNTPLACLITVGSVAELSNRSCELGSDISGNGEHLR